MTTAEEVKSRLDLVDIINEYVPLKPAGANWRARCPFHDEKSASFMVSKPKQIWHCFGCGEGGDVFTFVMKHEGIEFSEALHLLAEKAGVRVHHEPAEKKTERERSLKILEATVDFWSSVLWESPAAREARAYLLEERRLLPETIRAWRLGFAPDSWEALVTKLQQAGYSDEDTVKAGVAVRKMEARGRSVYDRFRNRIMFPIADAHGRIIGATGRVLPLKGSASPLHSAEPHEPPSREPAAPSDAVAKYVNTPETALYHKGRVLYGLDKAKTEIRKQNLAVMVEGNMDVLASHQAGVTNVIGVSGTALTAEQVNLLHRYTERLAFAFDADAAGEAATLKGLATVLAAGFSVRLIELPRRPTGERYKDPDEYIRANPEGWRDAIALAEPVIDHYLRRASAERDLTKLEDKQAVVRTLLPIIAHLPDKVAEAHYLGKLAALVQVAEHHLRDAIAKLGPTDAPTPAPRSYEGSPHKDSLTMLSERFLAALIRDSGQLAFAIPVLSPDQLAADVASLYRAMIVFYTESGQSKVKWSDAAFREHLRRLPQGVTTLQYYEVLSLLAETEFAEMTPVEFERELLVTIKRIKKIHLRAVLQGLEQAIGQAERAGHDQVRLSDLMRQFQAASAELLTLDTKE